MMPHIGRVRHERGGAFPKPQVRPQEVIAPDGDVRQSQRLHLGPAQKGRGRIIVHRDHLRSRQALGCFNGKTPRPAAGIDHPRRVMPGHPIDHHADNGQGREELAQVPPLLRRPPGAQPLGPGIGVPRLVHARGGPLVIPPYFLEQRGLRFREQRWVHLRQHRRRLPQCRGYTATAVVGDRKIEGKLLGHGTHPDNIRSKRTATDLFAGHAHGSIIAGPPANTTRAEARPGVTRERFDTYYG